MGLRPDDFGNMRPSAYQAVVAAYTSAENDRLIYLGELIRGATFRIVSLFVKRRIRNIEKFWKMPWDKEKKVEKDPEKRKKEIEKLLKMSKNNG